VETAIKRLKHSKAPGVDNITAEEIVAASQGAGLSVIHRLCKRVWEEEELPTEWKRSIIVPIHKKKDKLDCPNYRGISLLCHSSKVFSSVILQRIKKRTEEILAEAQAGFRANRSTVDQIFTLRQLAEKYEEFSKELYVCYIDFRKAFDSVWRKGLWKVMRHYGYPEKIIRVLDSVYKDTFSAARVDDELKEWFETIVGLLQGCVLSPLLFNIFLEIAIAIALHRTGSGAVINGILLSEMRFADDIALPAEKEKELQELVTDVAEISTKMGMCINTTKTETQVLGKGENKLQIQVYGQQLTQVDKFVYLGGSISIDGTEEDVNRRVGLARDNFQSMNKVWTSKDISKATKLQVYETIIL